MDNVQQIQELAQRAAECCREIQQQPEEQNKNQSLANEAEECWCKNFPENFIICLSSKKMGSYQQNVKNIR
ncbi:hypothetical protein [Terrihalobacillus insolitus]|uniref:hypothetical protein n=1 Tax=Terrihalobacillus insolitus TaxID=2950438 RepID=UPI00234048CC|nr:hypothetical protein [Terrihalobacillus insolitus]MDC3412950.1 hypothetical protein [Terrihalobacillus insolitus]